MEPSGLALRYSQTDYGVDEIVFKACVKMGFKEEHIYLSSVGIPEGKIDYIYVTEGNTFEVLYYMQERKLVEYIRECFKDGATYIGSSAGAIIAGMDIELAGDFDSNYFGLRDLKGLGLFAGTVIPHYEPDELKHYISLTPKYVIERYPVIYSVGNDEVLVIEGERK